MQDLFSRVRLLRRPRILARAARLGAQSYCRQRDLRRVLGHWLLPKPAVAALRLLELEQDLNTARKADDPGYSMIRHVDVLIALVGEAACLGGPARRSQAKTETAASKDRRCPPAPVSGPEDIAPIGPFT